MFSFNKGFAKLLSLAFILIAFFSLSHNKSEYLLTKSVFNQNNKDIVFHEDLNGDGKKDTIVIKYSNSNSSGQVNLNKSESYSLVCSRDLPSLGEYCSYWPIRISTIDLSRDNHKEIILQGTYEDKAVQQIFSWNKTSYSNIFSSNNNIIGFVDSCNSKTPKLITGNFSNGRISIKGFIYSKNELTEFNNNLTEDLPALDTLSNFIGMIESFPDAYLSVPNYFSPEINTNDLETLYRLANGSNYFKFQDGYFTDLAWKENGKISCENWILNFKTINLQDNKSLGNKTINLMINRYEDTDFPFKITSINAY